MVPGLEFPLKVPRISATHAGAFVCVMIDLPIGAWIATADKREFHAIVP
jgi:hypothetical protein